MDVPFEVAGSVITGLGLLNSIINEDITKKLILTAVKQLLINGPALPARAEIYESIGPEAKQADFSISCILVLSAQHSIDCMQLRALLSHHKIKQLTIDQLAESYEKFQPQITTKLANVGNSHNIPTLTNVTCDLQYETVPQGELLFKINLHTFSHGEFDQAESISEMYCNTEEMQSLINKLHDIKRHIEKLSK